MLENRKSFKDEFYYDSSKIDMVKVKFEVWFKKYIKKNNCSTRI
jgi:hypothetical protein